MTTFNDHPLLFKPKRQSHSHSPSWSKVSDDLLPLITPSTAVEALKSPTGAIRDCMALASHAEHEFAMRTALASQRIHEWLTELRAWDWPEQGGSAGFERHDHLACPTLLSSSTSSQSELEEAFMGCLRQSQVAQYARRIEEIYHGVDQLELEDIKTHIATSHIMPLSRSTTPLSETSRGSASAALSYNRMEDLSAIVTAVVMQTLPNIARLTSLLQTWTMRITVLQHVKPVLGAIEDAEKIMNRAWGQVSLLEQEKARLENDEGGEPLQGVLIKETFGPRKRCIMRKVAKPGKTLDYMLDCLEGLSDTLPDHWLDRMEAVEQSYSEWAAVTERKIREIDWLRSVLARQNESGIRWRDQSVCLDSDSSVEVSMLHIQENLADKVASRHAKSTPTASDKPLSLSALGLVDGCDSSQESEIVTESETPSKQRRRVSDGAAAAAMSPVKEEVDEEEEPVLPELRSSVMAVDASELADDTVLYGSHYDGMSSDGPEISLSPTAFNGPVRAAKYVDDSPPSSPPLSPPPPAANDGIHDSVIALMDSPAVNADVGEFDVCLGEMKSPLDGSFMDDYNDSSYSLSGSAPVTAHARGDSVGDQKLRNQISQIIEGIPANIQLRSDIPAVNLNPPDLQLPFLKKKASKDRFRRSGSALSSRAATPSFTLSPAKFSRLPRSQRGQQEIKVYHLSRSTGEAPIKLFIRCVGQDGERVMVRVGGGWADLSEYLKDYASHHGRRSSKPEETTVEVRDVPQIGRARASRRGSFNVGSSPGSRPLSQMDDVSGLRAATPSTPLRVSKTRRSFGAAGSEAAVLRPKTPASTSNRYYSSLDNTPVSDGGMGSARRSRSGSRLSWAEDDSSFLGLAGPSGKRVEMSEENKAWIESVKEKVRVASGERKIPALSALTFSAMGGSSGSCGGGGGGGGEYRARSTTPGGEGKRFGELGKVGGTKRLFRKAVTADGRRPGV